MPFTIIEVKITRCTTRCWIRFSSVQRVENRTKKISAHHIIDVFFPFFHRLVLFSKCFSIKNSLRRRIISTEIWIFSGFPKELLHFYFCSSETQLELGLQAESASGSRITISKPYMSRKLRSTSANCNYKVPPYT